MLKQLLERFKRVFTVAEWKQEAQDAMRKKEFVIESLDELHRVEKTEAAVGQERVLARGQNQFPHTQNVGMWNASAVGSKKFFSDKKQDEKRRSEQSLADLMNAIRQQQLEQP